MESHLAEQSPESPALRAALAQFDQPTSSISIRTYVQSSAFPSAS
jgi:hypothetical protein